MWGQNKVTFIVNWNYKDVAFLIGGNMYSVYTQGIKETNNEILEEEIQKIEIESDKVVRKNGMIEFFNKGITVFLINEENVKLVVCENFIRCKCYSLNGR